MRQLEQDYREILHQKYSEIRATNPAFSFRQFALLIGIAPSNLSDIFKGRCGVSRRNSEMIADALKMVGEERSYFLDLVEAKHARRKSEREAAADRVQRMIHRPFANLASDVEAGIVSHWQNSAVLELLSVGKGHFRPEELAARLEITEESVNRALETLERAQLIELKDGQYFRRHSEISVVSDAPSQAIRKYQVDVLELAGHAMMFKPMDQRSLWSTFFSFDTENVEAAKAFLQEMDNEFYRRFGSAQNADSVYCFAHQFFRVDKELEEEIT